MAYRSEEDALRARLEATEAERDAAVRERARLEDLLARLTRGEPNVEALEGDLPYRLAKVALWVQAGLWPVMVAAMLPAYLVMSYQDAPFGDALHPIVQGLAMTAGVAAFLSPPAILSAAASWQLGKRKHVGYPLALAAAGAGLLYGCVPLAVPIFLALMRKKVRDAFFPGVPHMRVRVAAEPREEDTSEALEAAPSEQAVLARRR